ncbi:hypothetical protein GDO81_014926 [Engystomops pustulosus]|uniref:Taste receptor type 2 n=1 Tax=Engystomops pustulosus TaxID=76066 RepID=A0AAV7AGI9_ENGPU|nr:hypothetical protein GDO81_014926 [Engystomops pustulosus]
MVSLSYIGVWVMDVASLLVIVPGHSGILMMYIHDSMKKNGLNIKDQLFCGLSICSLVHGTCQATQDFFLVWEVHEMSNNFIIILIRLITMSCTLFFSTWLSCYFCLKIVNLNTRWYIYVQRRFPQIFPWLLLLSVLGSVLCSAPLAFFGGKHVLQNTTVNGLKHLMTRPHLLSSLKFYITVCLMWFMLFLSSSCPIVVSLYQHMRRIQVSPPGSTIPTLEPHITAVKTITMLMIINVLYCFSLIFLLVSGHKLVFKYVNVTMFNICFLVSFVISIRGNQKVWKKLKVIVGKCPG